MAGTTISIPRLGVQAPIYEGGVLNGVPTIADGYALTHFYWSARPGQPGNAVLYGHDDIQGQIFRYLPEMQVGDRISIDARAANGATHRYVYRVTGSQVVAPTDVAVITDQPRTPILTLISCTPYWVDTQRIVVRAALVEQDNRQVASAASGPHS